MNESADIREILAGQVARFVKEQYSFEQRQSCIELPRGYSQEHWKAFAELGWLKLAMSENGGGFGASQADLHAIMHQFGRGMVMSPYLSSAVVASKLIESAAPGHSLLCDAGSGRAVIAFAGIETYSRYDLCHVAAKATPNDGGYAISGEKVCVAYGECASYLVVSARTAGSAPERDGVSLFLLPGDAQGVARTDYRTHDGGRESTIRFNRAAAELIGPEHEAVKFIEAAANCATAAICAELSGAMWALFEQTLEYLKMRTQFGSPIGSFQALQHRMADLYMRCELAHSLAIDAARAIDELRGKDQVLLVSAAKWQVGEAAVEVAEEAVQLHGAMGMMDELPIGHFLKRVFALSQTFGDSMHHSARVRAIGS